MTSDTIKANLDVLFNSIFLHFAKLEEVDEKIYSPCAREIKYAMCHVIKDMIQLDKEPNWRREFAGVLQSEMSMDFFEKLCNQHSTGEIDIELWQQLQQNVTKLNDMLKALYNGSNCIDVV